MNHITNNKASIEQMAGKLFSNSNAEVKKQTSTGKTFQQILLQKQRTAESVKDLKFSKHASLRLQNRNISISKEQMKRLQDGAVKAKAKGIQESLVMVDDLAFIINTKSNTVITAVNELENAVFTNIDGAVIN
ncbi:TIGR02530 family flagellar biosynthesis protein [[Clostridium] polysaccharolyticum]|uniref:Flagellar operon protein n=1 Tax=[Clostridium] polysaccharolyticum TaxID=29364 RepID=A0A1H9Y1Z5_9FIRM|nr:TIGR02530 family flagellar biosynthesis protein [[Clostridium] polysaccharolyticum]SES62798.1 flagellar operon protein [[Clostridium] polysaccharolyticum]